jgi:hypothetical protein
MRITPFLLLLIGTNVAAAGPGRSPRVRREVVIAPGLGASGVAIASLIAAHTGRGKPYYPRDLQQLKKIPAGRLLPASFRFRRARVFELAGKSFRFPETLEPVLCTAVSESGDAFEVADLIGRRVVFSTDNRGGPGPATYRQVPRDVSSLPKKHLLRPADIVARTFQVPENPKSLSLELARRQLAYSNTWRAAAMQPGWRRTLLQAQAAVNYDLIARISSEIPLTFEAIQDLTKKIVDASHLEDDEAAHSYWVIRGTHHEYVEGDVLYRVDLTGAQFTGALYWPGFAFQMFRNTQVPSRLRVVLGRMNRLSDRSSFRQALGAGLAYAEVLTTPDGHGRMAQALSNFALMKAGFPPIPATDPDNLPPFFVSEADKMQNVLRVYQAAAESIP